jgi:hypothetical protein
LLRRAGAGALALGVAGYPAVAGAWPRFPGRSAAEAGSDVATAWFRLSLDLVRDTPGFSPPVASRAFGYMGVTLYEALVPGMPGRGSLAGRLNGLAPAPPPAPGRNHWPAVANSALATITRLLFPTASETSHARIDALESTLASGWRVDLLSGLFQRSELRGRQIANHLFEWSKSDGGHEGYLRNFPSDFVPQSGPGLWEPTPPAYQAALQPYWGSNRPFALASGAEFEPGPPPDFSTEPGSAFYAEALEVYETVNNLTPEQRDIALFWSDDPGQTSTPPGHSISIMTQVLEARGATLEVAAEAYAKTGIAVADAFIACWHAKYVYNLIRPITYIQRYIDPAWGDPLPLTTPPFPEYPSGHSVQTGAFAQVLFEMFGDFPFTDHTHDARGLAARSYTSCLQMAEETAISRLYGGIHFRAAIERGVEQGQRIGRKAGRVVDGAAA